MLKVNPSITKTKDMQTKIAASAFEAPPNLTTNQLSSIVKVKNNQKVILGGLIAQNTAKESNKIPLLGDIPLIKPLFLTRTIPLAQKRLSLLLRHALLKKKS